MGKEWRSGRWEDKRDARVKIGDCVGESNDKVSASIEGGDEGLRCD